MKPGLFKPTHCNTSEKGNMILFAIFIMFAISLIAIIASNSTVTETKIIANQKKFDQKFAASETVLNRAIRRFAYLESGEMKIAKLLNLADCGLTSKEAVYRADSEMRYSAVILLEDEEVQSAYPLAFIEARRIFDSANLTEDEMNQYRDDSGLSPQALDTPDLPHSYYSGSIDRRRIALTATSRDPETGDITTTWVQKGIAVPALQDSELF